MDRDVNKLGLVIEGQKEQKKYWYTFVYLAIWYLSMRVVVGHKM